ncbi:hypothetical protein ARMGADRAFT_1086658 [Armillaria gallica]|uniref:Uncharacterized protein n=1 Tax=Armillaria gallica TaxID=47427 RepID=A0A2H3D6N4_ARMGA|nr:hypothetical protein ARMGADRAFT_1086658 [Armillaria gallica]
MAVYEYVNDNKRKTQVILCSHTPLNILLSFHSTVPMNFVSHDCMVSLYLRATFNLGVNYKRPDTRLLAVAGCQKYADHGWLPVTAANTEENTDHREEESWVSNCYCWVIPLLLECDPAGTTHSIASHMWKLLYIGSDQGWSSQYSLFKPEMDKPSYCISKTVENKLTESHFIHSYIDFPSFVQDFLDSDTVPLRIPADPIVLSSVSPSDGIDVVQCFSSRSSLIEESPQTVAASSAKDELDIPMCLDKIKYVATSILSANQ